MDILTRIAKAAGAEPEKGTGGDTKKEADPEVSYKVMLKMGDNRF